MMSNVSDSYSNQTEADWGESHLHKSQQKLKFTLTLNTNTTQ